MSTNLTPEDFGHISQGYHTDPARSLSLLADAYTAPRWYDVDLAAIISTSWQWVCHAEKLREPGAWLTIEIAGNPLIVVRDREGELRAFYNVCKHRAMRLLEGEGKANLITCPYHGWTYDLAGSLVRAPETDHVIGFEPREICLESVRVEEFCEFVFVNLDPRAGPLARQSGGLADEMRNFAPDLDRLTFAHRLKYEIHSNWKNVVDNFLECYHCPVAHKDFCSLVDMDTYRVTTHGIYSSHMAEAGKSANSAYSVVNATVRDHAVWWLWPNTCFMRYPGRGNMIVMQIIPAGPERTLETYDFFLETAEPNADEMEAITYLDTVLQAEDIWLVENIQKGMGTSAFRQGRIVFDPTGSGKSEHAVHHFHGLVLDAYSRMVTA
ncbi:MAG: Rieske 2Fe-2S domain-containing protein [Gammaproteobacteria bacterium]|nr:Rieske 2Fe-2S domain-containing protein [Gammaproteobacteria bacterium]MXY65388.1 Rieske 2Fe-2S domain-containing protein [Gammaproteobacteria bacterium]MYG67144.1 Rieske 2Fe-2S domain-containing protein [Gammaproteobacteria bacterium]